MNPLERTCSLTLPGACVLGRRLPPDDGGLEDWSAGGRFHLLVPDIEGAGQHHRPQVQQLPEHTALGWGGAWGREGDLGGGYMEALKSLQ